MKYEFLISLLILLTAINLVMILNLKIYKSGWDFISKEYKELEAKYKKLIK